MNYKILGNKDCRLYGFYHNDFTVPSREYKYRVDRLELYFIPSTGTVILNWDSGVYEYSWNSIGERTLLEFFFRGDWDYIVNKFSYRHKEDFRNFNAEATKNRMKEEILNERKVSLDKEEARELYNVVKDLEDIDDEGCFFSQIPTLLHEFFQEYDYGINSMHTSTMDVAIRYLKDGFLPEIEKWFKENIDLKTGELKNENRL